MQSHWGNQLASRYQAKQSSQDRKGNMSTTADSAFSTNPLRGVSPESLFKLTPM
jgi:hypothetical protein